MQRKTVYLLLHIPTCIWCECATKIGLASESHIQQDTCSCLPNNVINYPSNSFFRSVYILKSISISHPVRQTHQREITTNHFKNLINYILNGYNFHKNDNKNPQKKVGVKIYNHISAISQLKHKFVACRKIC